MTDDMLYPDSIVMLDVHFLDEFVLEQRRVISQALKGVCHFFTIVHTSTDLNQTIEGVIALNDKQVFEEVKHNKIPQKITPGNPDLKIVRAIQDVGIFQYYIRVEFDVYCIGDPKESYIDLINEVRKYDFAALQIATKQGFPQWDWWNTLKPPVEGLVGSDGDILKAFLPLMGFSRRFYELYVDALAAGWRGHYETLMPTIAKANNLKIKDLQNCPNNFADSANFRADPLKPLHSIKTRFIHPVKNFEQINAMKHYQEGNVRT